MLARSLQTDRQTDDIKSKRIPQAVVAGYKEKMKQTNIARTIQQRDYKGVSNQGITLVIEK